MISFGKGTFTTTLMGRPVTSLLYKCCFCGFSSSDPKTSNGHLCSPRRGKKNEVCPHKCSFSSPDKRTMKKHVKFCVTRCIRRIADLSIEQNSPMDLRLNK